MHIVFEMLKIKQMQYDKVIEVKSALNQMFMERFECVTSKTV